MITLQFVRGNDLSSKLIEWFGHGASCSHVDTVMPGGNLFGARADKVGGAAPGVQYRDPLYPAQKHESTFKVHINMTKQQEQAYYKFIMAQVGKPYDKLSIISFITGRNWMDAGSWFCSELVAAGLSACGYFPFPLAATSNKIDPYDLLLAVSVKERVIVP